MPYQMLSFEENNNKVVNKVGFFSLYKGAKSQTLGYDVPCAGTLIQAIAFSLQQNMSSVGATGSYCCNNDFDVD